MDIDVCIRMPLIIHNLWIGRCLTECMPIDYMWLLNENYHDLRTDKPEHDYNSFILINHTHGLAIEIVRDGN